MLPLASEAAGVNGCVVGDGGPGHLSLRHAPQEIKRQGPQSKAFLTENGADKQPHSDNVSLGAQLSFR